MSGKLIMKRKWSQQADEQQQKQEQEKPAQDVEPKRHRPESRPITPPAEEPDATDSTINTSDPHSILFEALQKIMELQSELDAFEQDLDERQEDEEDEQEARLNAEVAENFEPSPSPSPAPAPAPQRSQAEALGFAMCARETLLFLQSEGISTESVLYKALLGKLVGQSDGLLQT